MNIIKLSEAKPQKEYLIFKVTEIDMSKHKRLCELGFCPGLKVFVMKKNRNLLMVGALGCCFSIDRNLSDNILVYGD